MLCLLGAIVPVCLLKGLLHSLPSAASHLTCWLPEQYSLRVMNDSYDTNVCLQFEAVVIAASCILLTALARGVQVRSSASDLT